MSLVLDQKTIAQYRRLLLGPDYNNLGKVTSVSTFDIGGAKFKIVGHEEVPEGEVHIVQNGRCVQKFKH